MKSVSCACDVAVRSPAVWEGHPGGEGGAENSALFPDGSSAVSGGTTGRAPAAAKLVSGRGLSAWSQPRPAEGPGGGRCSVDHLKMKTTPPAAFGAQCPASVGLCLSVHVQVHGDQMSSTVPGIKARCWQPAGTGLAGAGGCAVWNPGTRRPLHGECVCSLHCRLVLVGCAPLLPKLP